MRSFYRTAEVLIFICEFIRSSKFPKSYYPEIYVLKQS